MTFWLFVCCYLTCCISLQFQFICTFLSFLCNDMQLCSCCAVAVLFRAISSNPCATLTWSISPCLIASASLLSESQIRNWADFSTLCCSFSIVSSFCLLFSDFLYGLSFCFLNSCTFFFFSNFLFLLILFDYFLARHFQLLLSLFLLSFLVFLVGCTCTVPQGISHRYVTRSPASAWIANRHNIEYLCLNLFTLHRSNNNESSGGKQILLPLLGGNAPRLGWWNLASR